MSIVNPNELNQIRNRLSDVLPLPHPYSVYFDTTYRCNFRCFYCNQKSYLKKIKSENLPIDLPISMLKRFIDACINMRFKRVALVGTGEPLLHPQIEVLVQMLSNAKITDEILIITNGSLLSREMSDKLISSGVSGLKISLQGLNDQAYQANSGTHFSFQTLLENLSYFSSIKKNCKLVVKAMDFMLTDSDNKDIFINSFSSIADELLIESLMPIEQAHEIRDKELYGKNRLGFPILDMEICSQPFYTCRIDTSGNIFPCSCGQGINPPPILGSLTEGFDNVWHGVSHKKLLLDFLAGKRDQYDVCRQCRIFRYIGSPKDILDDNKDDLIERYARLPSKESHSDL